MSHITEVKTQFADRDALKKAVEEHGGEYIHAPQTVRFMDGTKVTGSVIKLPGWQREIVVDEQNSRIVFDNYNGHWGKIETLNAVRQSYTDRLVRKELKGMSFTQTRLPDGTVHMRGTGRGL